MAAPRTKAVAVAALLAACASASAVTPPATAPTDSGAELQRLVREPLAAFAAEPPGSCDSLNLRQPAVDIIAAGRIVEEAGGDPGQRRTVIELMLDVAAGAAAGECAEVAAALYRLVVTAYPGPAYAGYRRRAVSGLAELETTEGRGRG